MATMRIDDFKTALAQGGARANLYRATVFWPNAQIAGDANINVQGDALHSFMFKTAQLPGSTITPIEVPFRGRKLKVTGDREFEDFAVTVVNDNNFAVRNAFERWHDSISGAASNISAGGLDVSDFGSYVATIEVDQLDRGGNTIKRYRMLGAWPTEVAAIDLSFDNGDIEEFGVTFSYQWWESDTTIDPTTGNFVTPPTFGQ